MQSEIYTGRVVSAQPCPYWTQVIEQKIKYGDINISGWLKQARKYEHLSIQGFSLIVLIKKDGSWQYVECYVYGQALIKDNLVTYIEVVQSSGRNGYELLELSFTDELSSISIELSNIEPKILPNGTVRNMMGQRGVPLLKCKYSRLVDAWLPSQVETQAVQNVEHAPAALVNTHKCVPA